MIGICRYRSQLARAGHAETLGTGFTTFPPQRLPKFERRSANAKVGGVTFDTLTQDNFVLPAFSKILAEALERLENGPGLTLIRGLPVDGLSKDDLRLMYWGLGKYLGQAVFAEQGRRSSRRCS